jgi:hypothetical protein
MKNSGFILCLFLLASTGFVKTANAQWTDMEWESYGIAFKAPTDFTIAKNDEGEFTASGAIFTMSITAWDDETDTNPEEICKNLLDDLSGTDKTILKEAALDYQNGLEGYEANCTAIQDGKLVHIIIGGYRDSMFLTGVSVQLLYWDDPEQNDRNYEAALYILRSLQATE